MVATVNLSQEEKEKARVAVFTATLDEVSTTSFHYRVFDRVKRRNPAYVELYKTAYNIEVANIIVAAIKAIEARKEDVVACTITRRTRKAHHNGHANNAD